MGNLKKVGVQEEELGVKEESPLYNYDFGFQYTNFMFKNKKRVRSKQNGTSKGKKVKV